MEKEEQKKKMIPYGKIGLSLEVINLLLLPHIEEVNIPITILASSLMAKSILNRTNLIGPGQDIQKIIDLYQIFLEEYHQLNKTFEIKDPIELFSLFIYMLNKGYFSHKKNYEFSTDGVRDIDAIRGANIMTGRGVCRHTSAMLKDIIKKEGIESHELSVYHRDYKIDAIDQEEIFSREELDQWIDERLKDEEDNQRTKVFVHGLLRAGIHVKLEMSPVEAKNILERIIGNHVINIAQKGDYIYYLDPTNEVLYRPSNSKRNCLMEHELEIPIKKALTKLCYSKDNYERIMELLNQKLPTVSKEEERERMKRVERIIQENPDLLEAFYEDHKELYADISNKVLSIKKIGPVLVTKN